MPIQSKNPATLEVVKTFKELSKKELEVKLAKSAKAFESWRKTSFAERAKLMRALGEYLRTHAEELSALQTLEMGKTMKSGPAGLVKCAAVCDYYAGNTEKILAQEKIEGDNSEERYVQFDPLGAVLAVMPWNFPFWQVYRFAAPAIMAGNVGLLKHASNVPQCAEAIEKSFIEAGFTEGVFQNLFLSVPQVESVIRDPRVVAVTLTGSERAGASVASIAASEIKKAVLELGGSDPFVVLEDADIARAAATACTARLQANVGQSCISAKRFIVHKKVAKEFTGLLVKEFEKLKIGDPTDTDTDIGPLATEHILAELEQQVKKSVAKGARVVSGGARLKMKGYFYPPTVLTKVKKGMPVYDEEVFGPVAPIIEFANEKEAIRIANDTPYGLGATLFTSDMARAKHLIPQIEAGNVFVNGMVKSDPRAPFGGVKKSGYGRELSAYGIKEFVNIKNVCIKN